MPGSHIVESTGVDDGIHSPLNVIFLYPFFLCIGHFQYIVHVMRHDENLMVQVLFCIVGTCCEWFEHGGMSQWGPLRDWNCEAIISCLCRVESWIRPLDSVF